MAGNDQFADIKSDRMIDRKGSLAAIDSKKCLTISTGKKYNISN
ncbi:MAG: hypothetical protein WCP01_14755 [Methylococcaceae bacterium]